MPASDLVATRIALAADVSANLLAATDPTPNAIFVVGSTALGRCAATSDLDLVAIVAEGRDGPDVTSSTCGAIRVDVEWLTLHQALATTEGSGWTWELRKAARLGAGVALHDPEGLVPCLAARAAAMTPDQARFADALGEAAALLAEIEDPGRPGDSGEALRGLFDNLAMLRLLLGSRRYQKAKWTIDDLLDEGEEALAYALLAAYGIGRADATRAGNALTDAEAFVDAALAKVGAPVAAALVAMGHAPAFAAASYVARTFQDAADLAAGVRAAEACYVAAFAVRLAAGLLTQEGDQSLAGAADRAGLGERYHACLPAVAVTPRLRTVARSAIDRCTAWLATQATATREAAA